MAKSKKGAKRSVDDGMGDWIASLAKQASGGETSQNINSKEERIQKRAAKKARRQQRQDVLQKKPVRPELKENPIKREVSRVSEKTRLKRIAQWMIAVRDEHQKEQGHHHQLYTPTQDRIKRTRALNEANIQPRPSDYSGIGLARKSLYIPFQDPSHFAKLEQEFKEHIPGFFGKQRTKAMKKQLDGNMLWRKLASEKEQGKSTLPKKFANLPPDDRVQAMIDAGMI